MAMALEFWHGMDGFKQVSVLCWSMAYLTSAMKLIVFWYYDNKNRRREPNGLN